MDRGEETLKSGKQKQGLKWHNNYKLNRVKVEKSNKEGWQTPVRIRKTLPRSPPGQTSQLESANYFHILQNESGMEGKKVNVGGQTITNLGMMIILSWKVRGLNVPNKQIEVKILCNEDKVSLIGLLETTIKSWKIEKLAESMFTGWKYVTNFKRHKMVEYC